MMRRLGFWTLLLVALLLGSQARAQVVTPLNPQQCQIPAACIDINTLVAEINTYFGVIFPSVASSVNYPSLYSAATGQPVYISAGGSNSDTNATLALSPKNGGNLILFYNNQNGSVPTGLLQIADLASWTPANGVTPCPGMTGRVVSEVWLVQDWLGRQGGMPVCNVTLPQ